MAKYVKKPTEYEAIQIANDILMPDWFKTHVNKGNIRFRFDENNDLVADVLAYDSPGNLKLITAQFGDYIFNHPDNGLMVFEKDYFEEHYEKVSD